MNHKIKLADKNVVIVADGFNTKIVNNVWLFKNKIFLEEELEGATNLPLAVEVATENFLFTLVPDRLQLSINPDYENAKDLITEKVGKLIKLLPHTPFTAVGLNFTYHITPENGNMHSLSRSLFCNTNSVFCEDFDSENSRFGGYFSRDLIGTKFRLDAKPVKARTDKEAKEILQLSYNFNMDLDGNNDIDSINGLIEKWDEAHKNCAIITEKVNRARIK